MGTEPETYAEVLSEYEKTCLEPAQGWTDVGVLTEKARKLFVLLSLDNAEIPREHDEEEEGSYVKVVFITSPGNFYDSLHEQRKLGYTPFNLFRKVLSSWSIKYGTLHKQRKYLPMLSSLVEETRTAQYRNLEERILTNTCQPLRKMLDWCEEVGMTPGVSPLHKDLFDELNYGIFDYLPILARDYFLNKILPKEDLGKSPIYTMCRINSLLRTLVEKTCAVSVGIKDSEILVTLLVKPTGFTINQGLQGQGRDFDALWGEEEHTFVEGVFVDPLWTLSDFLKPDSKLAPHEFLAWRKDNDISLVAIVETLRERKHPAGVLDVVPNQDSLLQYEIGSYKLKFLVFQGSGSTTVVHPSYRTVLAAVHSYRKYGAYEDLLNPIEIDQRWELTQGIEEFKENPKQGGDIFPEEMAQLKMHEFEKLRDREIREFEKRRLEKEHPIKRVGVPDGIYELEMQMKGIRPDFIVFDEWGALEGVEKAPKDKGLKETYRQLKQRHEQLAKSKINKGGKRFR